MSDPSTPEHLETQHRKQHVVCLALCESVLKVSTGSLFLDQCITLGRPNMVIYWHGQHPSFPRQTQYRSDLSQSIPASPNSETQATCLVASKVCFERNSGGEINRTTGKVHRNSISSVLEFKTPADKASLFQLNFLAFLLSIGTGLAVLFPVLKCLYFN